MPAFVIGIAHELAPEPMLEYPRQIEAVLARFGGRYRSVLQHQDDTLDGGM